MSYEEPKSCWQALSSLADHSRQTRKRKQITDIVLFHLYKFISSKTRNSSAQCLLNFDYERLACYQMHSSSNTVTIINEKCLNPIEKKNRTTDILVCKLSDV